MYMLLLCSAQNDAVDAIYNGSLQMHSQSPFQCDVVDDQLDLQIHQVNED